jgi:hypothetical protein
VNPVFDEKFACSDEKKYDLVLICSTPKGRVDTLLSIFKNPRFSLIRSFLYARDSFGLLNEKEKVCPQNSKISHINYWPYTNTILFLKGPGDYFSSAQCFCIKNNIKLLTDCEFTYNLINDPKKVKLIKD